MLLVAAALLFSTGGAAVKALGLDGWQIACFRSGTAAVVLALALPEARRNWNRRMVPVAAAYAATLICFVVANRLTTAANAIFLQSTAPLYLLLLGPLLLGERIRRSDLAFMAAVAAGMALFFAGTEHAAATASDPRLGNRIAALSGLTYAFALAGLRWMSRGRPAGNPGMATVMLGNIFACVAALPMALPVERVRPVDAAIILYLGAAQIGLAYWCVTRAMRRVPVFEANTVLLLEPAMNPVWVWLLHGEKPGGWALAGGAVILGATLIKTLNGRRDTG